MTKRIFLSLFLIYGALNADEPLILNKMISEEQKIHLYPYICLGTFVPGVGVCFRSPDDKARAEVSVKLSTVIIAQAFEATVSLLPTLKKTETGQIYLGVGAGIGAVTEAFSHDFATVGLIMPVFAGYEGRSGFVDIGANVISDFDYFNPFILPTVRIGMKF